MLHLLIHKFQRGLAIPKRLQATRAQARAHAGEEITYLVESLFMVHRSYGHMGVPSW